MINVANFQFFNSLCEKSSITSCVAVAGAADMVIP